METRSIFKLQTYGCLFFYMSLSVNLMSQTLTPAQFESQIRKLNIEIAQLNESAVWLRAKARDAGNDQKTSLGREAEELEKASMAKQLQLYRLNVESKLNTGNENKNKIARLQKTTTDKANRNHQRYLIDESNRNIKLAGQLAEEAKGQASTGLALGILDNANDKLDQALSQQEQVIRELEHVSAGVARDR